MFTVAVLEAGKSEISEPHDQVLVRAHTPTVSSCARRVKELAGSPCRSAAPLPEGPPHDSITCLLISSSWT